VRITIAKFRGLGWLFLQLNDTLLDVII